MSWNLSHLREKSTRSSLRFARHGFAFFPGYTLAFPLAIQQVCRHVSHTGMARTTRDSAGRENVAGWTATKLFRASSLSSSDSSLASLWLPSLVIFLVESRGLGAKFRPFFFALISRDLSTSRSLHPPRRAGTSTSAEELWGNVSRKSTTRTRPNWLIRFYWPAKIYRLPLPLYMIDMHRFADLLTLRTYVLVRFHSGSVVRKTCLSKLKRFKWYVRK